MSQVVTLIEKIHELLRLAATETISGGNFSEIVTTKDGRQISFDFAQATGMAWNAKKSAYSSLFGEPPTWLLALHPVHRTRLCDLSLDIGLPLPEALEEEVALNLNKEGSMPKNIEESPIAEFEVGSSGTLHMADFWEPTVRSEFYESVSGSWSESPVNLAEAMEECEPLAWAVHSIYTEIRDEIQSDIDEIIEKSAAFTKRISALKTRLKAMPEEPYDGVEAWLLGLTSNEFELRIVPEIESWFDKPPDFNWEDDYLPKDATAQGAALEFFHKMPGSDLDTLGVTIVEGEHPGSSYYAAELMSDIDAANKAAKDAGIPVRFKKGKG